MKIGYLMQEGGPDVRQKPLTGPGNHVLKIYRELQASGHHLRLLARYNNQIMVSDDLETFTPVTVKTTDSGPRRWLERGVRGIQSRLSLPYLNLFESLRYSEACRQVLPDCDLYYERMGWMGYGAGLAAKSLDIPLVLEINNGDFITELERLGIAPRGLQRWLSVELMRASVKRADHIVASGEGHRQRFLKFWKVPPDNVTTVENGSDVVQLLSREQLSCFRAQQPGPERIELVFVGAFDPWQGLLVLLAAMKKIHATRPDIHLKIIGSGKLQDQVASQISEMGLTQTVTMTGQVDIPRLADLLSKADIGIAPYCGWIEYSGLKLFDYKSAGLAIIASGENGQPLTLKHGQTAIIVPPCDQDALVEAILTLASDAALRTKLGQAARLEAEETHSWKHTSQSIANIFVQTQAKKNKDG